MRLSRKAGLLACGILWLKYNCSKSTETTTEYLLGAQQTISSGTDTTKSYQGLSGYTFDRNAGTVYASGEQITVDVSNPGAVYESNGTDGKSIYGYQVMSHGYYGIFTRTVEEETTTTTTYTVGAQIGSVRAAKGEYPDAQKGYTYMDTYNGYIIMRDSNGVYYAYIPASGGGSGDSSDTTDVYDVTFENGVLYIKSAPATLNGNTLEVE